MDRFGRLASTFSRWLFGGSADPPERPRARATHRAPEVDRPAPTDAAALLHGFVWDDDAHTARIVVGPWTARISPAGEWVNIALHRSAHPILDNVLPRFDAWSAVHLRSALASGLDPVFIADGEMVMVLGILADPAAREGVVETIIEVRRLLESAIGRVATHPDPTVAVALGLARPTPRGRESPVVRRLETMLEPGGPGQVRRRG